MLGLLVTPRRVFAEENAAARASESAAATAAESVVPPELVGFVEATYPSEARAQGLEGNVLLQLTIDASGRVSNAEVIEPLGHGFDEAARDAALQFQFHPARRGETPLPSKIRYSYAFHLPPVEEAPVPIAAPPVEPTKPVEIEAVTPPPAPKPESKTAEKKQPVEVTVRGKTTADRLRESAQAVKVVETKTAKKQSADMGEVLARTEGVGVRRSGGLGSDERISLNGLTDDQIRFFVDGVPLEYSGYGFGVSSIPVNFVEHVEIYQGVVPVRFGADALGGAVNLVTDSDVRGAAASASYEVGSFGTYRATVGARHLHEPTGFFVRANGFFDYAKNDYPVDVKAPDDEGQPQAVRIRRFHDGYRAKGGGVELGFIDRPWARRLLLRAYGSNFDKEIQHNLIMTVPYGEVTWKERDEGATLRYDQRLGAGLFLESVAAYSHSQTHFLDVGDCVYTWFGKCVRTRRQPGEIEADAKDQFVWQHSILLRPSLSYSLARGHLLRGSVATSYVFRTGEDRETTEGSRDPLTAKRSLLANVSGLEYQLDTLADRLENIVFAKHYYQLADSEEPLPGDVTRQHDRTTSEIGFGDSFRFRFTDWLSAKASYEWATRLPRPDEVFGDGALILDNLDLEPERSHNANLGLSVRKPIDRIGETRFTCSGFLREASNLIVLLGNDRVFTYQNVYSAQSLGVETSAGWTSPKEYLSLDANVTWQSFRNDSSNGTFGDFEGDRIPNRPWLFANAAAVAKVGELISPRDELSLHWDTRYVKKFYRGWESVGLREFKQYVPTQFTHTVSLVYLAKPGPVTTSTSFEIQNLTNQRVYDFYGVERPGRAFFWKGTLEI